MLFILGALILAAQLTTSLSSNALINEVGLTKKPETISIPYEQNPVLSAVVNHYNNKGQWAGTFKIDRIVKFRIDKLTDEKSIAHVKYYYAPVPNNTKGRTDSGLDQRTFTFIENDEGIKVIKMGAYQSAKL